MEQLKEDKETLQTTLNEEKEEMEERFPQLEESFRQLLDKANWAMQQVEDAHNSSWSKWELVEEPLVPGDGDEDGGLGGGYRSWT